MQAENPSQITALLTEWREGDEDAGRRLVSAVYHELRRLAAAYMRKESNAHTLQPTALVNELCLQMLSRQPVACENRLHFLHLAAQQMRRLIVDHARARKGLKRGGDQVHLPLDEARDRAIPIDDRISDLDEALTRLEQLDPRPASVVEMRFYGGLKEKKIAEILGVSHATVKRDWEFARCWLLAQLGADDRNL